MNHIPVFLTEVIDCLHPTSGGAYIDATLGDGGHSAAILKASSPEGKLLGFDQDANQIAIARQQLDQFGSRATLVNSRFSAIKDQAIAHGFDSVDGILFDLGISSRQLDTPSYGLTFADDAPLDMRLTSECEFTAADILNHWREHDIANLLYYYGDRHGSRPLARRIMDYRRKHQFATARDLKEALGLSSPAALAPIFQALRIVVNSEFSEIETALPDALTLLKPGGVLAVISFHSGEDRLVKRFFQAHKSAFAATHKITEPTQAEIRHNSRARSAKLRWGITKS